MADNSERIKKIREIIRPYHRGLSEQKLYELASQVRDYEISQISQKRGQLLPAKIKSKALEIVAAKEREETAKLRAAEEEQRRRNEEARVAAAAAEKAITNAAKKSEEETAFMFSKEERDAMNELEQIEPTQSERKRIEKIYEVIKSKTDPGRTNEQKKANQHKILPIETRFPMFILLLAIKIRNFERIQPQRALTNGGLKVSVLVATINNIISNSDEMNELLSAAESARISAAARMNATERAAAAAKAEATAKAEAEARAKIAAAEAAAAEAELRAKPKQNIKSIEFNNWNTSLELPPVPASRAHVPNLGAGTGLNLNPTVVPTIPNQLNAGVPELPMIEYEPPKRFWNRVRNYSRKARNIAYAAPGAIRNTVYAAPGALGRGIGAVGSTIAAAPGAVLTGARTLRNTAYATPSALLTGARTVGSTLASVPETFSSRLSGLYSWLRPTRKNNNNTKKTQGGRRLRRNRKTYKERK